MRNIKLEVEDNCPFCGNHGSIMSDEVEDFVYTTHMRCDDCEFEWENVYAMKYSYSFLYEEDKA